MNRLLNWITPKYIKKRIAKTILRWVRKKNRIESSKIPRFPISKEIVQNTKLLLNRKTLLEYLPENAIVAELGVDEGNFAELILSICKPEKLHLIDYWGSEIYNKEKRKLVEERFKTEIESEVIEINLGLSTEVGLNFKDEYFDWIYIDTDHTYQNTINELEIWRSKIKEGGVIAGHDFVVGFWDDMIRYGVIEAVYEFCSKYNWEILYLTMEIDSHPSFAIRRIK